MACLNFFKGRKLKGSFALVRIRGADSKNWLLIKHRDKFATEQPYNSEDETPVNSPINKFLRQKEITKPIVKKTSQTVKPDKSESKLKKKSVKRSSPKKSTKKSSPKKSAANSRTVKKK